VQKLQHRLASESVGIEIRHLSPGFAKLIEVVGQEIGHPAGEAHQTLTEASSRLASLGYSTAATFKQFVALLGFIGECTFALGRCLAHPKLFRWRPILYNIRSAGFDALPIVGLLAFLLGIVVAYQGADQLRQYGANIFVADLVGLSMLREFAPLITAIIVAGRSGSAYAAQIGTMAVTEEIDAMRTIGIEPLEMLVLPKIIAMLIVLPLLTVFADILGVLGGMLMARVQLAVSYVEFLERFVKTVSVTAYLIGVGKAPVFATIIVSIGCFQGFRTHGGADSVGRQTTRSVVQSIFLVIVADALFSVAFSALDL
jgi:phospholipid/cholesterol/gamma-HCH transport system permease protein